MTVKEYQEKVDEWIRTIGVRYFDIMTNMAILAEETGEVARIVAREWGEQSRKATDIAQQNDNESPEEFRKRLLADELADLMWVATCIANQTGIDLETALQENLQKKTIRDRERHRENKKLTSFESEK